MTPAHTLLCTVGTSLPSNLGAIGDASPRAREASRAWKERDWPALAQFLAGFHPADRLLGAEVNSVHDLTRLGYATPDALLVLFHSDSPEGRDAAVVLERYFRGLGHAVELREVEYLTEEKPKVFKSKGLRNLVKGISRSVRERGTQSTGIDATGGYKAEAAVAALIGQALGVPVYYKHERFSEIIAIPPMPVSFDQGLWMRWSGILGALDRGDLVRWRDVEADWEPSLEALVDRVALDHDEYIDLSPAGQIFHETFRGRLRGELDRMLPPPVPEGQKTEPRLTDHSWGPAREPVLRWLRRVVAEVPYVRGVRDTYWNPDLSTPSLFRLKGDAIEGVYSNGTWTVKFAVETWAATPGQREACVADLNARLAEWSG
ncbi:MAG: putative CRISPR-associated protein [Deltaproteobacteria bacterium]|nr:putative CRISPR-associated protein [Deltaproteobacteria bacterium]